MLTLELKLLAVTLSLKRRQSLKCLLDLEGKDVFLLSCSHTESQFSRNLRSCPRLDD